MVDLTTGREDAALWLAQATDPAGTERRLTDFGHEAGGAVWSPDGRHLAFVSHDHDRESTPWAWIVTIDPETGARRDATRLALPPDITDPGSVAWSPDGTTLAVASSVGSGRQSLWLVSLAGGTAKHLIDYSSTTFGGVAWTPDGRTLIYSALAGAQLQLFAIDATGGAARLDSSRTTTRWCCGRRSHRMAAGSPPRRCTIPGACYGAR